MPQQLITQRRVAIAVAVLAILAGSTLFTPFFGGGVLGTVAMLSWGRWLWGLAGSGRFVKVASDVYRLDLWWRPLPLALFPLTSVLVRDGQRWVLVDAGAPNSWSQGYADRLVKAVEHNLPRKDSLDVILLTHAHPDHVGGLPQLLAEYPSAEVVIHEREAPFLTEGRPWYPSSSALVGLAQAAGLAPRMPPPVDRSRVRLLRGETGDLAQFGVQSLSWVATPGHSPGHVSYLHAPSGTLLLGDALFNIWPSASIEGGLGSVLTYPLRKFGRGGAWAAGLLGNRALGMLPRALTDLAPVGLLQAVNDALLGAASEGGKGGGSGAGGVRQERAVSAGVSVAGGAGDERSEGTVPQGGAVKGQPAGAVKVPYTWGLPKLVVKVKPMFICPRPTGDEKQGHASICRLAGLDFKQALPMHDATGKGLSKAELQAFAASLPGCR